MLTTIDIRFDTTAPLMQDQLTLRLKQMGIHEYRHDNARG